jgi:F-type H+-transporting ATPase subunit b
MTAIFHEAEFWVLVAAVIFVLAVGRKVFRLVAAGLDARSERIRNQLDEARVLREEAERLLAEYQTRRRDALTEAEAIVAHAKEEAKRIAAQAARDLGSALERRRRLAEERIAQAEAKAVGEIRATAVDIAIAAAREVIAAALDERRAATLIDSAIAALPQALH